MLSYRHAFHAGNHADVLKHFVLLQIVRYLAQKEKPLSIIDTHAGAGIYALDSAPAGKLEEFREGIGRLWEWEKECNGKKHCDRPPAVADYVAKVRQLNSDGRLRKYPGSPWLIRAQLRTQDRLWLFELHSRDARILADHLADTGKRIIVSRSDGFAGLKALLPPPSRRGLALIDPPYEEKRDYERVVNTLKDALRRFAGGTYMLWYPQLARKEACELPARLKKLPAADWLHVTLRVRAPAKDGLGMHGSGLFIINPPWTLHDTLADTLPYLTATLAQDDGASFMLERSETMGTDSAGGAVGQRSSVYFRREP